MTLHEALLSLQLMAEERVGSANRVEILAAKAAEDAAAENVAAVVRSIERGRE